MPIMPPPPPPPLEPCEPHPKAQAEFVPPNVKANALKAAIVNVDRRMILMEVLLFREHRKVKSTPCPITSRTVD
jgi:hypothetical protein